MRSSAENPDALVDTSVAVALVVEDHEHHAEVLVAVEASCSVSLATPRSRRTPS
jgi:predicted nucleic acid-binding protein